jgi:hypothetical protein
VQIIDAITLESKMFNICTRKVGGLRFIKLGRLTFMFCLSREYRPL